MESYINESRCVLSKSDLWKQEGNSQVKQRAKSFAVYKTYVRFLKRNSSFKSGNSFIFYN